ncbi:MAG: Clp protease ClpP [Niameybacter sp.]
MAKLKIAGDIISNDSKWIYDWLEYDCTCPKDVEKVINEANGEKLEVEINSGGGEIFAGSEIYGLLRSYGNIGITITGLAASAASVIAMAGNCKMYPTAMMMVHNVSTGARGDHNVMKHTAQTLETANEAIANAYVSKTGMSMKDALALMNVETWFSAQQAKEKGLIDEVAFENATHSNVMVNSLTSIPPELIDKIRNKLKQESKPQNAVEERQKLLNQKKLNLRRSLL